MVFLLVSREVLERRLMARPDHFFPEKLLDSQLAALEPPAPDERVETVLSEGDPAQTAAKVIAAVWPARRAIPRTITWADEADARPARHLQPGHGDREGAAADLRRGPAKKAPLIEIIPGKGSGQLKKHVLRFLEKNPPAAKHVRIEKDSKNFGRIFVHFRWK